MDSRDVDDDDDGAFFDAQGAEELDSAAATPESNLSSFPQHLVHNLLLEYTSPIDTDAFLMTCKGLYEESPAVWRLRYETMKRTEAEAAAAAAAASSSVLPGAAAVAAAAASSSPSTSTSESMDHQTHRRLAYEGWSRRGKTFLGKIGKGVSVMHGHNTNHWVRRPMRNSSCGTVLELVAVCWFDLSARCYNVRPGKYDVSIRVMLGNSYYGGNILNVELKCMPTDASERAKDAGPVGLVDLASSNAQWNPDSIGVRKDWATVHLGTVTVTDRAGANIQARLWKHTGSWIRNLYFDYVQVREVGAREEEEYARSWWHVDSTKRDGAGGEGGGRKSWSFW